MRLMEMAQPWVAWVLYFEEQTLRFKIYDRWGIFETRNSIFEPSVVRNWPLTSNFAVKSHLYRYHRELTEKNAVTTKSLIISQNQVQKNKLIPFMAQRSAQSHFRVKDRHRVYFHLHPPRHSRNMRVNKAGEMETRSRAETGAGACSICQIILLRLN